MGGGEAEGEVKGEKKVEEMDEGEAEKPPS